jgi:hypothetical protein
MTAININSSFLDYCMKDTIMNALINHTIQWGDVPFTEEEEQLQKIWYQEPEQVKLLSIINQNKSHYPESDDLFKNIKTSTPTPTITPTITSTPSDIITPFISLSHPLNVSIPSSHVKNTIKTIILRNLPRDSTSEELHMIFEKYGPVRDIYIPRNMDKSSPYFGTIRGFALVKFFSAEHSSLAYQELSTPFCIRGKYITIEFAKEDR